MAYADTCVLLLVMHHLWFTSTPESAASLHQETACQKEYLARDTDFYMGHDSKVRKVMKSGREQCFCCAQAAAQSCLSNCHLGYSKFAIEEVLSNKEAISGTDTSDAFTDR
jgi:hypothetical protein